MTFTVCFAGSPNVGKSTLFNALTGLHQHTGNWTGKTVDPARGRWSLEGDTYLAVDLPGVYSLSGGTPEERVAADWLAENNPDCVVAVLDATALERTLPLALELRPRCRKLILCLNLMDEAQRLGLRFQPEVLSRALSAPVVPTRADRRQSAEALRRTIAVTCLAGGGQVTEGVPDCGTGTGFASPSPTGRAALGRRDGEPVPYERSGGGNGGGQGSGRPTQTCSRDPGTGDPSPTGRAALGRRDGEPVPYERSGGGNGGGQGSGRPTKTCSRDPGTGEPSPTDGCGGTGTGFASPSPTEASGSDAEASILHARTAASLARAVCPEAGRSRRDWDRILLGKWTAWPVALALLFGILYLTVRGANYPSALLEGLLSGLGDRLRLWLRPLPSWLRDLLTEGVYGTTAKVVAVMLPPMAIFFPLFSLLEDLGFLPRLAFLLDRPFARAGTCGRQGLCMCMGCGCNAVGVTGCRIIAEPKQRLAAILTNALTPCNGRFSTLFLLMGLLLGRQGSAPEQAALLTGLLVLSVLVTLAVTRLLRRTVLKGEAGSFVLELPPFRRPRIRQLLVRSVLDRTLRILGRAVTAAAPAGALIWLLSRIRLPGGPLLAVLARGLDPAAAVIGLSGTLLLAFFLSFPANELLLPLAVLIAGAGESAGAGGVAGVLTAVGMGPGMALCAMLFTLFHWPCATTVLTVHRETGSLRWTLFSILVPTAVGILLCAGTRLLLDLLR